MVGSDSSVYLPLSTGISASAVTYSNVLMIYLGTDYIISLDFLPFMSRRGGIGGSILGNRENLCEIG